MPSPLKSKHSEWTRAERIAHLRQLVRKQDEELARAAQNLSVIITDEVQQSSVFSPLAKILHGHLLAGCAGTRLGDRFFVQVKIATLARDLGKSERNILRAMKELVDAGLVERRRSGGTGRGRETNSYLVRPTLELSAARLRRLRTAGRLAK